MPMKKLLLTFAVIGLAFAIQAGDKDCPLSKNAAACPQTKTASADKNAVACPSKAKASGDSCCKGGKKVLLSPKDASSKR